MNKNYFAIILYSWNSKVVFLEEKEFISKQIRTQISLNTCQGCHSGETKTSFTQMMPRGYGEPAKYWDAIPDYLTTAENHTGLSGSNSNAIDKRFVPGGNGATTVNNTGVTFDYSTKTYESNINLTEKTYNTTCQIISPFLTGRLYSTQTSNHWQDDELNDNPTNNGEGNVGFSQYPLSDEKLTGLYFVNDPSNDAIHTQQTFDQLGNVSDIYGGIFPQLHKQRWGFNDLQFRQNDLCNFIQSSCDGSISVMDVIMGVKQIPFPKGGH